MSKDQIIDSLGRIDDEIISKVNQARTIRKPKPQIRRWAAIAACFALIISMALTAEATNGTVSNLLAPLFGGAQTEIMDTIGVPVGASTSVNGYTLTVDAIIGDRYSVMIAYTLTRDDGKPIPNNIDFDSQEVRASVFVTGLIHVVSRFLIIGNSGIFCTHYLFELFTKSVAFLNRTALCLIYCNFSFHRR